MKGGIRVLSRLRPARHRSPSQALLFRAYQQLKRECARGDHAGNSGQAATVSCIVAKLDSSGLFKAVSPRVLTLDRDPSKCGCRMTSHFAEL
jgi:hypothetical protein